MWGSANVNTANVDCVHENDEVEDEHNDKGRRVKSPTRTTATLNDSQLDSLNKSQSQNQSKIKGISKSCTIQISSGTHSCSSISSCSSYSSYPLVTACHSPATLDQQCWSDKFNIKFASSNKYIRDLFCTKRSLSKYLYFFKHRNRKVDANEISFCIKMSFRLFLICVTLFLVKFVSAFSLPRLQSNEVRKFGESKYEQGKWNTLNGTPSMIFAHRGEKVLLPEHTLAGYETASILGADYVEPDLCLTKDDKFVCHHDLFLRDGTDVSSRPEFDNLKTLMADGTYNWYIRNFTLAELKTLRIIQQNTGIRPQDYNSFFSIPTFQEYLDVIHKMTYKLNKTIGIVPELKEPTFHNTNRAPKFMEKLLLQTLSSNGYPVNNILSGDCQATLDGIVYKINCPPVIVQCFEMPTLEYLKEQSDFDLLMLVQDPPYLTFEGIKDVAKVAKYYAPWKEYLYVGVEAEFTYNNRTWNETEVSLMGGFIPPKQFTTEAHKYGMQVVIWTFHDSREPSTRGCAIVPGCEPEDKKAELSYYFNLGVDGVFIENVAESRLIRQDYEYEHNLRDDGGGETLGRSTRSRSSGSTEGNVITIFSCLVAGLFCGNEKLKYNN